MKCLGLIDEAKFAFRQQILIVDDSGMVSHSGSCSTRGPSPIEGIRRVCQICPDIDMRETCVNKISSRKPQSLCRKHPFIEDSNQYSTVTYAHSIRGFRWRQSFSLKAFDSRCIQVSIESPPSPYTAAMPMLFLTSSNVTSSLSAAQVYVRTPRRSYNELHTVYGASASHGSPSQP